MPYGETVSRSRRREGVSAPLPHKAGAARRARRRWPERLARPPRPRRAARRQRSPLTVRAPYGTHTGHAVERQLKRSPRFMFEERDKGRLLSNLVSLPNELDDLVAGMSDEDLRWRPIPNKWSIGEILVHLRDVERDVFQVRLRRTLEEDNPTFVLFDPDETAWDRNYHGQSATEALAEFRQLRGQTIEMLSEASLEAWQRVGVHPERGAETVEALVTRQIRQHDVTHMIQIK